MEKDLKSLIILFKAQTSLANSVKKSLEDTDINLNEFVAMEALYTKDKLTTHQLAESILIPNSSLTYVVDVLTKKGYVQREQCNNDRRVLYISLTKDGQRFFKDVYSKHFKFMRPIFDTLSEEEEEMMKEYLKRIGKASLERSS